MAEAWQSAASKYGFATDGFEHTAASDVQRRRRARYQTDAALDLVSQLQLSLADADPQVRLAAREGTRRVMHRCYTGDQSDRAWRSTVRPYPADRLMQRWLGTPDPDGPEPRWRDPRVQRSMRYRAILAALSCAGVGAVLLAVNRPLLALAALMLAAALDVFDGAYARSVGMRDGGLRWLSCIGSHGGDMVVIGAVAYGASGRDGSLAAVVLAGMLVSLAGSFVRVSALQAGYQFWRSPKERALRYTAIIAYCVFAAAHLESIGAIVVSCLLTLFGASEIARVVVEVVRRPSIHDAGVMFVDSDDEVRWWTLADDSEPDGWSLVDAVAGFARHQRVAD